MDTKFRRMPSHYEKNPFLDSEEDLLLEKVTTYYENLLLLNTKVRL